MSVARRSKISELHTIVGLMPLNVCCTILLPEFGLHWKDVSQAIRNNRLHMTPSSVAHIVTKYAARNMTEDEISEIVSRLKLKSMIIKPRKWHVVKLMEKINDIPVNILARVLPSRITQALKTSRINSNRRPEVQAIKFGDLIYISIRIMTSGIERSVLYIATPPSEPIALVSSVKSSLLKPCVAGLGYGNFEDSCLHGRDVASLLRIFNEQDNPRLDDLPEYNIAPVPVRAGIDYTGREFNESYAKTLFGPDPPKLEKLMIIANRKFCAPRIMNKKMKVKIVINSESIAKSLCSWLVKGAFIMSPSLWCQIVILQSNVIHVDDEEE